MTIANDITAYLDTAIDAMTVAGGYNYAYDNVNEYDPSARTYPSVMSSYADESAEAVSENMIGYYTSMLGCAWDITVDDTDPVDEYLDKVLEDFKRLIIDIHDTLQSNGMIWERPVSYEKIYTLKTKRPGKIEIRWGLKYRVLQSNPSST